MITLLERTFGSVGIFLLILLVIIAIIIAMPFFGIYLLFLYISTKYIFKHRVYVEVRNIPEYDEYKRLAREAYGRKFFMLRHTVEIDPGMHFMGDDILVGAHFFFLRSQDAVHFKLINLPD